MFHTTRRAADRRGDKLLLHVDDQQRGVAAGHQFGTSRQGWRVGSMGDSIRERIAAGQCRPPLLLRTDFRHIDDCEEGANTPEGPTR